MAHFLREDLTGGISLRSRRHEVLSLSLSLCSLIVSSAVAQLPETRYSARTILVKFREQVGADRAREQGHPLLDATRSRVAWSSRYVEGLVLVETPPGLAGETAAQMALGEDVEYAQRDAEARPTQVGQNNPCITNPNDPTWISQQSTAEHARIHANEGWKIRTDSGDVIIAIVDYGINYNLAEFNANMWKNPGENPTPNGLDDDANGIVDDIYGADFSNPLAPDGDPMPFLLDHGCNVAGMAGAKGNSALTVSGVAWTTKIMALRGLAGGFPTSASTESSVIMSIEYAIDHGARVINCSFTIGAEAKSLQTLMYNEDSNVLFIIAAGNDSSNLDDIPSWSPYISPQLFWPLLDNALFIGASGSLNDTFVAGSQGSNYGVLAVDLCAPGLNVQMLNCDGTLDPNLGIGSSLATPMVSATAAMVMAQHPSWTIKDVRLHICATADVVTPLLPWCRTGGRLNLARALEASCN